MEKLRPVLKQRFWICFGLTLIFVLVGWWNASGDLAAKIVARKSSVDGSFSKAGENKTAPNADWVAEGKKENDEDAVNYRTAARQLWERQQTARVWPEEIRSDMKEIAYFSEVNSKENRERWAFTYQKQIEELLQIVQPYQHDTGEGLVLIDEDRITRQQYNKWRINVPTSNDIWSSQEDIWLLKVLLTSIAKTNDSATRIGESQVREIKQLRLRGGDRKTKAFAPGAGGAATPRAMGGGDSDSGGGGGGGGGGGRGTRGDDDDVGTDSGSGISGPVTAGRGGTHPGSAFEGGSNGDILVEEFGAVAGAGGMRGSNNGDGFGGMGAGAAGGGSGAAAKGEVRYVDDAEKDLGYKTRAFLLDVVVRDERLPDLLAKLTNSDFPVEIVRVEISTSSGRAAPSGGAGYGTGVRSPGGNMSVAGGGRRRNRDEGDAMRIPGGAVGIQVPNVADGLRAAMSDPLLIDVRIGGLLTLYMTPEETEMQAKTEEADEGRAVETPPVDGSAEPVPSDAASPGEDTPSVDSPSPDSPTIAPPVDESTPVPTDQPTTDQPTTDQPTTDQPTTDQPTTDQPTTDQPTTDQPTTDQPTTDQPTTDTPGADDGAPDVAGSLDPSGS